MEASFDGMGHANPGPPCKYASGRTLGGSTTLCLLLESLELLMLALLMLVLSPIFECFCTMLATMEMDLPGDA